MNISAIILQTEVPHAAQSAAEVFKQMDPYGIGMTLIAMTVVFSVLAIIYLTFKYISRLYSNTGTKAKAEGHVVEMVVQNADVSSEVSAAIGMAIHMYRSQQDDLDNLTLTINRVSRMYSPWSSKIYTLRQLPR